jgi:spore coat protein U-like protein
MDSQGGSGARATLSTIGRHLVRMGVAILLALGGASAAQAGCSTASSTMTFAPSSSYDVRIGPIAQITGSAGLTCTGSTLSLLGGTTAKATFTSTKNFVLTAGGTDQIPYAAYLDNADTNQVTQGGTKDYMSASVLALLGSNPSSFTAPLYLKISATPNVAAGTYTDTLSIAWDYSICNGAQVAGVCVGYETGKTTATVQVTIVVTQDCRIIAPPVVFGTAPLPSGFASVSQAVAVDCSKGSTYKVAFTAGASGASRPWRAMSDGAGHSLQYNLYRLDGTTIWDTSNPVTSTLPGTGAVTPVTYYPYVATINPAQAAVPAATYTDTVSVTVTF